MDPAIEYAHAVDGNSIALWSVGDGPPFVSMPNVPWSHIELEWLLPESRHWFLRLAEKMTLIRYDSRGSGSSDREAVDYSLDAHVSDLEAVVNHLGLETFNLFGPLHSGPAAIAYAANHPERVSRLILWCTYASGAREYSSSPQLQATRALLDQDWEVYTETLAHVSWGWSAGEKAREFASFIRQAVTRDVVTKIRDAIDKYDVVNLLQRVASPTLILHRRQFSLPRPDVARRLASTIPNARLVLLEGRSPAPYLGDTESVFEALGAFLGVEFETAQQAVGPDHRPITILFTDVEGSTALTGRLGDLAARDLLREHERITRDALNAHGGAEVKTMGDGFMASFPSVTKALECSIALQQAFAQHNESADEPINVRIGLNAGEPIRENDPGGRGDLFGTAVNMAARIAAQAQAGEILASNVVRELVAGKGFLFNDRGDTELRGFEDPVRLYEVRWRAEDGEGEGAI